MSRRRLLVRWRGFPPVVLGVAALLLLSLLPTGAADASPAVSPARIVVDDVLRQGDEVRLPSLSVRNRGDERALFEVRPLPFGDAASMTPSPSWFRFSPGELTLDPGERELVGLHLSIPRDASAGQYRVLLQVRPRPDASGATSRLSATVATYVAFEVERRHFRFYDPAVDFLQERAPFSYIGIGMLAGLSAIAWVRRRYSVGLGIRIERR